MSTKEERDKEKFAAKKARKEAMRTKEGRMALRQFRLLDAQRRQAEADELTYSSDSLLLSAQSSAKGDADGGIYDLSTTSYEPPTKNESDANSNINDDSIDKVGGANVNGGGSGVLGGFSEETLDVVEDDNTAGQRIFLVKEV